MGPAICLANLLSVSHAWSSLRVAEIDSHPDKWLKRQQEKNKFEVNEFICVFTTCNACCLTLERDTEIYCEIMKKGQDG